MKTLSLTPTQAALLQEVLQKAHTDFAKSGDWGKAEELDGIIYDLTNEDPAFTKEQQEMLGVIEPVQEYLKRSGFKRMVITPNFSEVT